MSESTTSARRPGTITVVAVLIYIAGITQLIATATAVFLAFRPSEIQTLHGQPVSDWYWIFTAILSFVMALIYFWIGRGALSGNAEAWMLINILCVINIFFALFQLAFGTGWVSLVVNLVVILINNTQKARAWYKLPTNV